MTSQRRIFAVLEQFGVEGFCRRSEWCVYKFWAKQHTHALSLLFHIYWSLISISSKVFCHIDCVNQNWMCCNWRQRSQICVGIVAMVTPQCTFMTSQRVGVHSFESRSDEAQGNEAVIWGSLSGETRPLYSGMDACLNCIWSNINHCHCIFIDIVLYSFLIIGVHSFDRRPYGAGYLYDLGTGLGSTP